MKQNVAVFLMIITTLIWGSTYPILKFILAESDPFSLMFSRFSIALVLVVVIFYKQIKATTISELKICIIITIPYIFGMFTQLIGLKYAGPTNAAFITSLTVLVVPLILRFKDKMILDRRIIFGIAIATIGIAIMTISANFTLSTGDMIVFLSMFSFSFFVYLLGKYGQDVDAGVLTAVQFSSLVVISLPFVLMNGEYYIPSSGQSWGYYVFLIVICSVIAMFMHNKVQPFVPTILVGIVFLLEPVSAAIISWFMGEELTTRQLIGATLILLSLFFAVEISGKKKEPNSEYLPSEKDFHA